MQDAALKVNYNYLNKDRTSEKFIKTQYTQS